jgi:chromosome segregation ATPase
MDEPFSNLDVALSKIIETYQREISNLQSELKSSLKNWESIGKITGQYESQITGLNIVIARKDTVINELRESLKQAKDHIKHLLDKAKA